MQASLCSVMRSVGNEYVNLSFRKEEEEAPCLVLSLVLFRTERKISRNSCGESSSVLIGDAVVTGAGRIEKVRAERVEVSVTSNGIIIQLFIQGQIEIRPVGRNLRPEETRSFRSDARSV